MIEVVLSDMGMPQGLIQEVTNYNLCVRFAPHVSGKILDAPDSILADLEILTHIRELYECARTHADKTFFFSACISDNNPAHPINTLVQDLVHLFQEAGPIPDNITFQKDVAWFIKNTRRAQFTAKTSAKTQ
jgi:hypothetical protein